MEQRLCVVYNFAQHYRKGIFQLMDQEWPCDWYFGQNETDIKGLDLNVLQRAKTVKKTYLGGHFYWLHGVPSLLCHNEYRTFLMLGQPYSLSSWVVLLLARLWPGKHIYLWCHGWYGKESCLRRLMKKTFFSLANGAFLYGNYAKKLMTETGMNSKKLFVIHNSLDYDTQLVLRKQLQPSDIYRNHFGTDIHTIVFIGRLTAVKRLDLLIEALAILHDQGERYNLAIVGDGEKRTELDQLVAERGLQERVWFYGACYDERTNAELIYNADLCVSPGNVGLTAMHTMMFGCPVLTHNRFEYQMPEFEAIRVGKTGAFFDYESTRSLADSISQWFAEHPATDREAVRRACYEEIDTQWTPQFQLSVMKPILDRELRSN